MSEMLSADAFENYRKLRDIPCLFIAKLTSEFFKFLQFNIRI